MPISASLHAPHAPASAAPPREDGPGQHIDLTALTRTLCELGRVERLQDLGTAGPMVASAGADSLFCCLFGRDSLRMATDLLDDFPVLAHETLVELARFQGVAENPRAEEEPGRILHEHRHPDDPHAARLSECWDFPYYGAVDSTPNWINLLVAYCERMGSTAILDEPLTDRLWRHVTLRDSLLAAVRWIVRRLDDPQGGGYLWVRRASQFGIPNQVWEDSPDSYYYADGALVDFTRPYAPVHVQGYTYDALLGAADLLERGAAEPCDIQPEHLRQQAAALRARVLAHFWQPDLGTFAQALTFEPDGSMRAARVVASSPGHLLASRLLDGPEAAPFREQLAQRFGEADVLAAAGIRTKSTMAARFLAGSYHNGSTWPVDSGIIAEGLRRHGYLAQAEDVEDRILRGCAQLGCFPEFFRGDEGEHIAVNVATVDVVVDGVPNRLEQPPQTNQGWTATRVWRILRLRGLLPPVEPDHVPRASSDQPASSPTT